MAEIVFCGLAILFGLTAAAVAGYNVCSRPYESWAGPAGLLSYFACGCEYYLEGFLPNGEGICSYCSKISL